MGQQLHTLHARAYPANEAQATAADALSATILQAVAPRPVNLAHFMGQTLDKGMTEPNEVADMLEQIEDRVWSRFESIPETTANAPLIAVLYDLHEALGKARGQLVKLDALCEGITL